MKSTITADFDNSGIQPGNTIEISSLNYNRRCRFWHFITFRRPPYIIKTAIITSVLLTEIVIGPSRIIN